MEEISDPAMFPEGRRHVRRKLQ